LFSSCTKDEAVYEPFIVTGIEAVSNTMSNYYEKGEDKYTMTNYVLAPTGKYKIGDTIPEASVRFK
jgi:hypothetical protein